MKLEDLFDLIEELYSQKGITDEVTKLRTEVNELKSKTKESTNVVD